MLKVLKDTGLENLVNVIINETKSVPSKKVKPKKTESKKIIEVEENKK